MGCTCAKADEDSSHLTNGGHLCCSNCFSRAAMCKACSCTVPVCRVKRCGDCGEIYCSKCLHGESSRRRGELICSKCLVLSSGQFMPQDLMAYSVRELRHFLFRMEIAIDHCKEKSDLIDLVMQMSCSSEYRSDISEHTRHVQLLRERMQREQFSDARNAPSDSYNDTDASGFHEPPNGNFDSLAAENSCPIPTEKLIVSEFEDATQTTEACTLPGYVVGMQTNGADIEPSGGNQMTDEQFTADSRVADLVDTDNVAETRNTLSENKADVERLMLPDVETITRTSNSFVFPATEPKHNEQELADEISRKKEGNKATSHLCLICSQVNRDCVFLECGHMATCFSCGEQLVECPICHLYISRRVRAFRA